MIQAVLKDGKRHRFIGDVPKEWEDKILWKKELVEDEILKVPIRKDNSYILMDNFDMMKEYYKEEK